MRRAKTEQLDLPLGFRQQQAVGRAYLTLEGTLVSYTIRRSLRRRAISILIDEEGLRVGAPWDATHHAIERLLRKHASWILRKLAEWEVRRASPPRWTDGEQLMLLGQPFTLRLLDEPGPVHLSDAQLCVGCAGAANAVARQVREWLHRQALACFEDRVAHYVGLLGIEAKPKVLLSSARTRWGSCHASGRIHLNWRLVQMPAHLLDYVVAHEVAHLIEMSHSPRFWDVLGELMPDYADRRKELRQEGHRYLLV